MDNFDALSGNESIFNSITLLKHNEKEFEGTKRKRSQLLSKQGNKKQRLNKYNIEQNTLGKKESIQSKKVKVAATSSKSNEPEELVLDDINITMIEDKKAEYDAFADFLKTPSITVDTNCIPDRKHESDKDNTTILSQFFDTQMIKQVDSAIGLGSSENMDDDTICKSIKLFDHASLKGKNLIKSTPCSTKSNVAEIKPTQKNDMSKNPLFLSFKERLKSKDWNDRIQERSLLFEDEKATTTYRKEVDNLFEQIEHSIFAMGDENAESGKKLYQ
nr:unnamed protein product [Callosobruchus chinensis]